MSFDVRHKKLGDIRVSLIKDIPHFRRIPALPPPSEDYMGKDHIIRYSLCREILAEALKEIERLKMKLFDMMVDRKGREK